MPTTSRQILQGSSHLLKLYLSKFMLVINKQLYINNALTDNIQAEQIRLFPHWKSVLSWHTWVFPASSKSLSSSKAWRTAIAHIPQCTALVRRDIRILDSHSWHVLRLVRKNVFTTYMTKTEYFLYKLYRSTEGTGVGWRFVSYSELMHYDILYHIKSILWAYSLWQSTSYKIKSHEYETVLEPAVINKKKPNCL